MNLDAGSLFDPASLADEMRRHGHDLIDRIAEYFAGVAAGPVSTPLSPADLEARLGRSDFRTGGEADAVWDEVFQRIVPDAIHFHHPMYVGHQVAPPLPHAVLADALVSLLNNSLAVWEMSPTGSLVEAEVIRWLAGMAGYPEGADGTFVSGGSVANLTALLAAREAAFPGCWERGVGAAGADRAAFFAAGSSHYSIERAVAIAGFGAHAVVRVPERGFRLDPLALRNAIRSARAAGRVPVAVIATAGSTATGTFDDLEAVADVAAEAGAWFHVDGAHGASFLCSAELRPLLRGIERADSIAWDMHKMMWMPLSAGALLVREGRHLEAAFRQSAPYLFQPAPGESRSRDAGKRTLQCSRRFDALKVWIALRLYGSDRIGELQERTVAATRHLHGLLAGSEDFQVAHEPDSNILCFRILPPHGVDEEALDALQLDVRRAYNVSGEGWLTATELAGRRHLRVTIMNPSTSEAHLRELVEGLRRVAGICAS